MKRNKCLDIIVIIAMILLIFFAYKIRLLNYTISIDTEAFINNPIGIINSWYSIGRFSLGFYKSIFNLIPINISLTNIISLILMFLGTLITAFKITNTFKNNRLLNICLFVSIVITSPLFAEQYVFTLQSIEFAISYCLMSISFIFIDKYIYNNKYLYLLLIFPILVLCFGTYQSFYLLYITLSCLYFICHFIKDKKTCKEKFLAILKYISVLIVGFLLTIIVSKIVTNSFAITSTSYLKDQINWFNLGIVDCILRIGYYFIKVLLGLGIHFNLSYLVIIILFLFNLKKEKCYKNHWLFILSNIFLLLTPFLMSIICGGTTINRIQISLPIVTGFMYIYLLSKKKTIYYLIPIVFIIIQSYSTHTLFKSDLERYKKDVSLSYELITIIDSYDLPVVFIGETSNDSKIKGDTLGRSFYNWDLQTEYGSNYRIHGFMKTLGFDYKYPTTEEIKLVKDNLEIIEDDVSVFEDVLVIKLKKED